MSEKRTLVDEDRYLFTTEVSREGIPDFVAVHWSGVNFTPNEAFLRPLRAYLRVRLEISEVWFVVPGDLLPLLEDLSRSARLGVDEDDVVPRVYRFFVVEGTGTLREELLIVNQGAHVVDDETAGTVITDGLRQLFRDTDSLATATAGYHFTHPSGSHSEYFIRASQSVSRVQHAYFVAMGLTRCFEPRNGDSTVWLDTASISALGYAYADLLRRSGTTGHRRVETFGGYTGVEVSLRPAPNDVVLISGSTSCSLAHKVMAKKSVPAANLVTLFYLGARIPGTEDGRVLCDLTNRDSSPHPSVREARIVPYTTFKGTCEMCEMGSGEIRLEGDSFFPAASQLDLRMPTFVDRPLDGVPGARKKVVEFDGSDYFNDLFGLNVITFDPGTAVDSSPHGVSTRLGHVFDGPLSDKLDAAVKIALSKTKPVAGVVSLLDDDSTVLGGILASRLLDGEYSSNLKDKDVTRREWRRGGAASFSEMVGGGTILVCAAVVGSGRKLTDMARELRKVPAGFDIRYFVGAAHPESSTTWEMLTQTLKRVSPDETSELHQMWRLPREPRFPGTKTPWARELAILDRVGVWLSEQPNFRHLASALETRLLELQKLTDETMFVGAVAEMSPVNRSFALWPFDWQKHPTAARPTHAEIYATVAHLLYESRRRSPRIDSRNLTARRHGYALHPAVFDRFNDPIIQASILRAAEPGELHYTTDRDASRAVTDLLWFVLSNVGSEAGDAAYEFLLALCEGCDHEDAPGMRIHSQSMATLIARLERTEHQGKDFAELEASSPRLRALLLFLRQHALESSEDLQAK